MVKKSKLNAADQAGVSDSDPLGQAKALWSQFVTNRQAGKAAPIESVKNFAQRFDGDNKNVLPCILLARMVVQEISDAGGSIKDHQKKDLHTCLDKLKALVPAVPSSDHKLSIHAVLAIKAASLALGEDDSVKWHTCIPNGAMKTIISCSNSEADVFIDPQDECFAISSEASDVDKAMVQGSTAKDRICKTADNYKGRELNIFLMPDVVGGSGFHAPCMSCQPKAVVQLCAGCNCGNECCITSC